MKQFTNLYPVSKTLRFELIPEGKRERILTTLLRRTSSGRKTTKK